MADLDGNKQTVIAFITRAFNVLIGAVRRSPSRPRPRLRVAWTSGAQTWA